MAFQSETVLHKCCLCTEDFKWHKMMYSENPGTKKWFAAELGEAANSSGGEWKQLKCCPGCELKWRLEVPITGVPDVPEWATMKCVTKDLKT